MKILMMTNTFLPHVGGVARSVDAFAREFRSRGHNVLIIAPEFENMPEEEEDVIRVPAIQHFNGSDFSVVYPLPGFLRKTILDFGPDIVHSHHPFLLGATALRVAHILDRPLVFTHHTMYEQYSHYVPGDSPGLRKFAISMTTRYANLCDQLISPSESVAEVLRERGITAPIGVVPTGVNLDHFKKGNGPGFRAALGIPADAFVVGHLGRLAPEKNLPFLARAVAQFLKTNSRAHFLLVGTGPSTKEIEEIFVESNLKDRIHHAGVLGGTLMSSAYRAMDVFAFASKSETQGMVLTEAMATGAPVVGIDAPGVREVVRDGENGRLIMDEDIDAFVEGLQWVAERNDDEINKLRATALETADKFSMPRTADTALALYESLLGKGYEERPGEYDMWSAAVRLIHTEWDVIRNVAEAATEVIRSHTPHRGDKRNDS